MYATDFGQMGENIKRLLACKGLTQQRLADELGLSKQVMSKIIRGNKALNARELAKIATVLGTTTDELLTVTAEPSAAAVFNFMGRVRDEETLAKVDTIRRAIDEIHFLEDLLYG